jgi:hypothetical protein
MVSLLPRLNAKSSLASRYERELGALEVRFQRNSSQIELSHISEVGGFQTAQRN